jgi:REP element-mobilizing transposase RayT
LVAGDKRGWTKWHAGVQLPSLRRELEAAARMNEAAVVLNVQQRRLVEETLAEHCALRGWTLHAVNCRTNHVHAVLSASVHPNQIRSQLKAWSARKLSEQARSQGDLTGDRHRSWWGERGSRRFLNDEASLEAAILYVRDAQD